MVRKLAFISDIHSNIEALDNVIHDIKKKNIPNEDIYCLGDLVGYGPRPNEVIELIKDYEIRTIMGNYDEAIGFCLPSCGCNIDSEYNRQKMQNSLNWTSKHILDENRAFLRELEEEIVIEENGFKILLTHGSPFSINDYVFEEDFEKQEEICSDLSEDLIVFGHTHFPYHKKIKDKIMLNAGSVGRPKDSNPMACYAVVDIDKEINIQLIRVPYNVEKVAEEIENSELLNDFAQILRFGSENKITWGV